MVSAARIARRIATATGPGGGTRAGEIELEIPKIRQGSYFPSFLQPRKRSEQALVSVVQQGLCVWRLRAAGRSARREPWAAHQQVGGQPDRRAARRAGAG